MHPPQPDLRSSRRTLGAVLAATWAVAVAAGFRALDAHDATPGVMAEIPARRPSASSPTAEAGRAVIVMAAHPKCPCTRASLATLGTILDESIGRADVQLLVYRPADERPGWAGDGFREAAGAIRGARWVDDPGGAEAARLGLETSGAVAAFDASGRLRFRGGLTPARGREGPSEGGAALRAILDGGAPEVDSARVFGCGLGNGAGGRR